MKWKSVMSDDSKTKKIKIETETKGTQTAGDGEKTKTIYTHRKETRQKSKTGVK